VAATGMRGMAKPWRCTPDWLNHKSKDPRNEEGGPCIALTRASLRDRRPLLYRQPTLLGGDLQNVQIYFTLSKVRCLLAQFK